MENAYDGFNVYEKCETMTEYNARCKAAEKKVDSVSPPESESKMSDIENDDEPAEMTIYNIVKDMKVGKVTGTYYQTYGGGPEGGFLFSKDNKWYELDRTWHQPWKVTARKDMIALLKYENGSSDPTAITVMLT